MACGDATDKSAVAALFAGRRPTLVVTSPPYADARSYNDPIPCWGSMMLGAFDGHEFADEVQLLVNLGVIHRKGEWIPYWWEWLQAMRRTKWLHVAQYIWDKTYGMPGTSHDRLAPSHEFVFHLQKNRCKANKSEICKRAGRKQHRYQSVRRKNGHCNTSHGTVTVATHKTPSSVIRLPPVRGRTGEATEHPAQMPTALAAFLIRTWQKEGCIVYDPFGGAATTLLACEAECVDGLAMEISPAYCDLAMARWRKIHPGQPIFRVS